MIHDLIILVPLILALCAQGALVADLKDQLTSSQRAQEALQKELVDQQAYGVAVSNYATGKSGMETSLLQYEADALKLELCSLQQRLATFDYDSLAQENHVLRAEVRSEFSMKFSCSKDARRSREFVSFSFELL